MSDARSGARPRLAVTVGDPRGIGPELVAAARADLALAELAELIVIGPSGIAGLAPDVDVGRWSGDRAKLADAGALAGAAVETAARLAMAGDVDGLVTAPLDKAALLAGGFDYPGHTEMLGALAGAPVAMMLASDRLRVVLVTTHLSLRDVADALTHEAIARCAAITRSHLVAWFGIERPRIALCALNPHAGDGGRFGHEDDEILRPAAAAAGVAGPYPADTVFVRALRGEFDAVLAPYHDVGMTAIKVASFGAAVNVTLGLPYPRTSPDHGTALDIAGQGIADPSSFFAAVRLCARLAATRQAAPPVTVDESA